MKNKYLTNIDVSQFISFLVEVMEGNFALDHEIHIKDNKTPKKYDKDRKIDNFKDAFDSYFWDGKNFDQTSALLSNIQIKLCDSYFSEQQASLLSAVDDVLDWGLMPKAANHNKAWANKNANFVESIRLAMKEMASDNPHTAVFDDTTCRMNAGFTKVYALLHPGIIIYDGRVGAGLGYLTRKFLVRRGSTTTPKELQFPWAMGTGSRNRNPSCGKFEFPSLQSVSKSVHAEWNIKASWIMQAVVRECIKKNVSWLSGNPLRQLESALFMIGYELPICANSTNITPPNIKVASTYVPSSSSIIHALCCDFNVNELIEHMQKEELPYLIQGQQMSSYKDHSKKKSLDYWIRGKSNDPEKKQADNGVIEQLVRTGYFYEDQELQCPETRVKCKGIVLVTE